MPSSPYYCISSGCTADTSILVSSTARAFDRIRQKFQTCNDLGERETRKTSSTTTSTNTTSTTNSHPPTNLPALTKMSDSIKVEEKPKLDDITMEDASTTTPVDASKPTSSSTLSALEEFASQKDAQGEWIIKQLPDVLKDKSEQEVAEVKKNIVEQGESQSLTTVTSPLSSRSLELTRPHPLVLLASSPRLTSRSRILLFR